MRAYVLFIYYEDLVILVIKVKMKVRVEDK